MQREFLDETIDRVARDLTTVSADDAFGARVRQRLSAPRHRPWRVLVAVGVASAAAVVTITAALWTSPERVPATAHHVVLPLEARGIATIAPLAATVHRPTVRVEAMVAAAEHLSVEPIAIEPLPVEAPVQIDPLYVGDLQVPAIEIEDIKEQR